MPKPLQLFETGSNDRPDDSSTVLARIEDVFGDVEVLGPEPTERINPFALVFHTAHIIASPSDLANGSAQRVPPCGDQTPAYLGDVNGPRNLPDDDSETAPLE